METSTVFHLLDLKTDQSSMGITLAVVFGQEDGGLGFLALRKKPTGRFRDEPHEADDQDACEALADEGDASLVVGIDIVCSICDCCSGDIATGLTVIIEA